MRMFCIRIYQLLVCDAQNVAVQLKSGIRDHVFMCMFCIRISQLLVCDARDLAVQLKAEIRDHVFTCNSVYVYI